jgi:hypothetical protein
MLHVYKGRTLRSARHRRSNSDSIYYPIHLISFPIHLEGLWSYSAYAQVCVQAEHKACYS